jgi:hypothetical protein
MSKPKKESKMNLRDLLSQAAEIHETLESERRDKEYEQDRRERLAEAVDVGPIGKRFFYFDEDGLFEVYVHAK